MSTPEVAEADAENCGTIPSEGFPDTQNPVAVWGAKNGKIYPFERV